MFDFACLTNKPFFILHIYYIIIFYKNQKEFFGRAVGTRTLTDDFGDHNANQLHHRPMYWSRARDSNPAPAAYKTATLNRMS